LDLVREQLLVAQGLPLSVRQEDLGLRGHAIEARLYAEDPEAGFLPATGELLDWHEPAAPPARWDSGVATGSVVGVEWDPMLAKVIAHAPDRGEAATALALALERARIRGVTTNRDFLVAALRHTRFLAGATTTDFVETAGVATRRHPESDEIRTAAVLAALAAQARRRAHAPVLRSLPSGWRNSVMPPESVTYRTRDGNVVVTYRAGRDGVFAGQVVTTADADNDDGDGHDFRATVFGWDGDTFRAEIDGRGRAGRLLEHGHRCWVQTSSGDVELERVPRFPVAGAEAVSGALAAPMPGRVLAVHVEPGARVSAGDALVVVEAMKMEHRVSAPHAGTVTEVRVGAGDQVAAGDLLVVLADSEAQEAAS
ncbi:MAG: biotin/lipoyl-containing protein, partial [Acidimicrobiales bacterium]